MKKTGLMVVLIAVLTLTTLAQAQFGGLKKLAPGGQGSNAPTPAQTLSQCSEFVQFVTAASDLGIQAMDELAQAFPPEKIAAYTELSKKYHELQANRPDGNINAEGVQTLSAASTEMAKLTDDWKSYKKDGATHVAKADRRLGIMLLADGAAGLQLPPLMKSLQSTIESVAHDPMQAGKLNQLKAYATLFTTVGQEMPKQVGSFKTVRGITKQIAIAENIKLAPDPTPDSIKDRASFITVSTSTPTD